MGQDQRTEVRAAVRSLLEADRAAGRVGDLSRYEGLFPGFSEVVAEEFRSVLGAPPAAAPAIHDGRTVVSGSADADPPREPGPPPGETSDDRLGPYRLLRELGRGGMGVVYLAEDTRIRRHVALKVLSPQFASSGHLKMRFRREAEVASRIDHPNICAVYDADVDGEVPYIAMRYVEGKTLQEWIAISRQPTVDASTAVTPHSVTRLPGSPPEEPPAAAQEEPADARDSGSRRRPSGVRSWQDIIRGVTLLEKAARALHVAHEAGLIHRDIKPGNIMVTADGDPVLLDFGLARADDEEGHHLTQTGSLMGTPSYMSPEQLTGQRIALDRRTDVYSLGVTLYECLTLRLPYEAPTLDGLYQKILATNPENARRLNPAISDDLRIVLETAMEKDRDQRYQTALDLAEDLRRVREHEPIAARPPEFWYRVARFARRNQVAVATSVIAFLCAGFLAWAFLARRMGADPAALLALGEAIRKAEQPAGARLVLEDARRRIREGAVAPVAVDIGLRRELVVSLLDEARQELQRGRVREAAAAAERANSEAYRLGEILSGGASRLLGVTNIQEHETFSEMWRYMCIHFARQRDEVSLFAHLNGKGTFEAASHIRDLVAAPIADPAHPLHAEAAIILCQALATQRTGDPGTLLPEGVRLPESLLPSLLAALPSRPAVRVRVLDRLPALAESVALDRAVGQAASLGALLESPEAAGDLRVPVARWLCRSADLPPVPQGEGEVEGILARWREARALDAKESWRRRVRWAATDADGHVPGAEAWLRARTGFAGEGPAAGWASWWGGRAERDPATVVAEHLGLPDEVHRSGIPAIHRALLESPAEKRQGLHTLLALSLPPGRESPVWYPAEEGGDAPPRLWAAWTRALEGLSTQAPVRIVVACVARGEWQAEPVELWTETRDLSPGTDLVLEKDIALPESPPEQWPVRVNFGPPGLDPLAMRHFREFDVVEPTTRARVRLRADRTPSGVLFGGACAWTTAGWTRSGVEQRTGAGFLAWGRGRKRGDWPTSRFVELVVVARVEDGGIERRDGRGGWADCVARGIEEAAHSLAPPGASGAGSGTGGGAGLRRGEVDGLLAASFLFPSEAARAPLKRLDAGLRDPSWDTSRSWETHHGEWVAAARLRVGDGDLLPGVPAMVDPAARNALARVALESPDAALRGRAADRLLEGWASYWQLSGGLAARLDDAARRGALPRAAEHRARMRERNRGVSGFAGLPLPSVPVLLLLSLLVAVAAVPILWPMGRVARRLRPAAVALGLSALLPWIWIEFPEWAVPTLALGAGLGILGSAVLAVAGAGRARFLPLVMCAIWGTAGLAVPGGEFARSEVAVPLAVCLLTLVVYQAALPYAVASLEARRRQGRPAPPPPPGAGWWKRRGASSPTVRLLLFVPAWIASGFLASQVSASLIFVPLGAWLAWVLWPVWREGTLRVREEHARPRSRASASGGAK